MNKTLSLGAVSLDVSQTASKSSLVVGFVPLDTCKGMTRHKGDFTKTYQKTSKRSITCHSCLLSYILADLSSMQFSISSQKFQLKQGRAT